MGNNDDRTTTGDLRHVLLDDALRLVVERAGRLVEDQDARVVHQGAGNGDALALTAGKRATVLANDGVVALGGFQDEVVGPGLARGRHHPFQRCPRAGQGDVLADTAVEEHVLLLHHADLAAQRTDLGHRQVGAIHQHPPALGHIHPADQLRQGALARSGAADHAQHLTGRDLQADPAQHLGTVGPVAEMHLVELDSPVQTGQAAAVGERGFRGCIEDVAKPLHGDPDLLEVGPHVGQTHDRLGDTRGQHVEGNQLADGQVALDHQPCPQPQRAHRHQLSHKRNQLAGDGRQLGGPQTGGDIAGQLLVPLLRGLRLHRHRLEGVDTVSFPVKRTIHF